MSLPPAFRYPGSKLRLAGWIQSFVPAHASKIVPYAGSLGWFLNSPRSRMESVNDLDDDVVNFFRVLRERRDELVYQIRLTPYSLREFELSQETAVSELERARRFYARSFMAFKPYDNWRLSFRRQYVINGGAKTAAAMFSRVDHLMLIAERLSGVCIDCMDALDYIERYDNDGAFFYVDPPYLSQVRAGGRLYRHDEMDDDAHTALFERLSALRGSAIVSGYASDLYARLYEAGGWQRYDRDARTSGKSAVESIWVHPRIQDERMMRLL